MEVRSVDLLPAFSWICPECGKRNFERAVVWEGSSEEEKEMMEDAGIGPEQQGIFLRAPVRVVCYNCDNSYETDTI